MKDILLILMGAGLGVSVSVIWVLCADELPDWIEDLLDQ